MTTIMKGSQVTVTFSVIAFSHSAVGTMYSYNGMPCLLTIIAGTGMVLDALDRVILSMTIGEEREIIIPAVEGHQTARSLGVNIKGLLKYELKILQVVNTPVGDVEIAQFLGKRRVSFEALSETKAVKKGPFNIIRSYEMIEANAISEEYRILESLHKEYYDKEREKLATSTNPNISNPNKLLSDIDELQLKSANSNPSLSPDKRIHLHWMDFRSHRDSSSSSSKKRYVSTNYNDDTNPIGIKTELDPKIKSDSSSQYVLSSWPLSQPKELFLPELLRIAVSKQCKIIVLFDNPTDWDNITEQMKKTLHNDKNKLNCSSKNHRNLTDNNLSEIDEDLDPQSVIEADIDMIVESEETDSTQQTVLTWLRVATNNIDICPNMNDNNKTSTDDIKNESNNNDTIINYDQSNKSNEKIISNNQPVIDDNEYNEKKKNDNANENVNKNKSENETISSLNDSPSHNIISDSMGQDPLGYRVCLIRFSGWVQGCAPQWRLWEGFWQLYTRALNEISVGLISQPLSVLILDVGSIMVKSDKEIIKVTNQNQNLSTIGIPEMLSTDSSPSSSSIASESISSLTKENINKCADKNEQSKNNCVDLSAKNRDTYWGIGNRASMFILACKVADSIKEEKMLGVAIEPDRSREKDEEVGTVCNSSVVAPNIYDDTLTANEALKEEKENKEDKRNVVAINSDCNKNYSNSNSSSCSNNHDNSSSTRIMNEYTVTDSSPDLDLDSNIPFISDLSRAKETSAKMLADCEINLAVMNRRLLEEKVKAKARLASRLRERDRKLIILSSSTIGEEGNERIKEEEENEKGGFDDIDIDNENDFIDVDDKNDFMNDNLSSILPLPPLCLSSPLISTSYPPIPINCNLNIHTGDKIRDNIMENESKENIINNTLKSSVLVDKKQNLILDLDSSSSSTVETNSIIPSICIPQLLYYMTPKDFYNKHLEYLFLTHAQYKFIYKIACELNKK